MREKKTKINLKAYHVRLWIGKHRAKHYHAPFTTSHYHLPNNLMLKMLQCLLKSLPNGLRLWKNNFKNCEIRELQHSSINRSFKALFSSSFTPLYLLPAMCPSQQQIWNIIIHSLYLTSPFKQEGFYNVA